MTSQRPVPVMTLLREEATQALAHDHHPRPETSETPLINCFVSRRTRAKSSGAMPAFLEINDSGEGRLYSILERYDAKFVELADRLTSVTSKLAPMQDTLLLVQQRVTQVVDHMDAMVQKIDADKLSFVHLREYAEEKASEEARTQDLIADLDRLRNTMQERLSKCEAQVAMRQTTTEETEKLHSKIECLRTQNFRVVSPGALIGSRRSRKTLINSSALSVQTWNVSRRARSERRRVWQSRRLTQTEGCSDEAQRPDG